MKNNSILRFENITIDYPAQKLVGRAVNGVTLEIEKGKITAFVGESGSGKTTIVSSIINFISSPGRITNGRVLFIDGEKTIDISKLSEAETNKFRWEKVSMVFQASQSTLNPLTTIYDQFYETAFYHDAIKSKEEFGLHLRKLFDLVKLDADRVLKSYPHQLSGGMKQRVMIAFALLLHPEVIILDEPTTALDVITQEYIFNQLLEINRNTGITMLLLTHDMGAVAKMADNVVVMYGGSVMEYSNVDSIFEKKMHPYTRGLVNATPSLLINLTEIKPIGGTHPDIRNMPVGCPFQERCDRCMPICKEKRPNLVSIEEEYQISCHLFGGKERTE